MSLKPYLLSLACRKWRYNNFESGDLYKSKVKKILTYVFMTVQEIIFFCHRNKKLNNSVKVSLESGEMERNV